MEYMFSGEGMEFSVPKRIGKSNLYTQTIWDEKNKKGFIALLEKRDNTYYIHGTPNADPQGTPLSRTPP